MAAPTRSASVSASVFVGHLPPEPWRRVAGRRTAAARRLSVPRMRRFLALLAVVAGHRRLHLLGERRQRLGAQRLLGGGEHGLLLLLDVMLDELLQHRHLGLEALVLEIDV